MAHRNVKTFALLLALEFLLTSHAFAAQIGGVVRDKNTAVGIPHVVVRVTPVASPQLHFDTLTSRNGTYVIKVRQGRYQVQAIPIGTNYLPAFYTQSFPSNIPAIVELVAEDMFSFGHIDLELGGSIQGRVSRLLDGTPLSDIRVSVESENYRQTTTTDKSGHYLFRALPKNDYVIEAGASDSGYMASYFPRSDYPERATHVPVRPGDRITGINLRLELGARIQGRILSATSNQPLPDIKIIAEPVAGREPERVAYSDHAGFFTISGLRGGKYRIEAGGEAPSLLSDFSPKKYVTQFFDHVFDRELAHAVEVSTGSTLTGVDFSLSRGNQIRGRVRSSYFNAPLPNVTIRPVNILENSPLLPSTQSTGEGQYVVENLPPGDYLATVELPEATESHVPTWYRNQLVRKKASIISLRDGDAYPNVDFNLPLGSNISGRVTVDDPDYPIDFKRLHVVLSTVGNEIEGFEPRTYGFSEDGHYSIVGAPSGRFHLAPKSEDPNLTIHPVQDTKTVLLSEGRDLRDVDFALRLGGSISGKVIVKRSRLALDRYQVLLLRVNEPFHEFYKLQGDTYTIPGLRSGRYIVVLVEEQEPMTLEKLFTGSRFFDSRIVDVKKGIAVTDVNFVVDEGQPLSLP